MERRSAASLSIGQFSVGNGNFRSACPNLPRLSRPTLRRTFGGRLHIERAGVGTMRALGPTLPPLRRFLLLQGVETLHLRMPRHWERRWRSRSRRKNPAVNSVNYAMLPDNPYEPLARRYLPGGAVASSARRHGRGDGRDSLHDSVQFLSHLANLGDAKSLACHPASTTHRQTLGGRAARGRRDARDDPPFLGLETLDNTVGPRPGIGEIATNHALRGSAVAVGRPHDRPSCCSPRRRC